MNQAELEAAIAFHEHEMDVDEDPCPPFTEQCEAEGHEENTWYCAAAGPECHSYSPRQCFTCYLEATGKDHG